MINGKFNNDQSGRQVASAGDVNGDGFDDLIIGARFGDALGYTKNNAGDIYVVFGGAGDDTLQISDLAFARAMGGSGTDTLALAGSGMTLNLADIANTKLQDIERIDLTGTGGNTLRLTALEVLNLSSTSNTLRVLGDAGDAVSFGAEAWTSLGPAGGFTIWSNGQARVEVAAAVTVLVQPIDLSAVAAGTGGFVILGQDAGDRSGFSVASAGDVNGDGFGDVIIGAVFGDGAGNAKTSAGDSYVVLGAAGGFGAAIDLATVAAGTGGFVILGEDTGDRAGHSVASVGDVNGDGLGDLIIGARYADGAGNLKSNAGGSYVVFGAASGFGAAVNLFTVAAGTGGFVIHGQDASDYAGYSVSSAGDINGDGFDDLVVGALGGDAAGNAKSSAGDSYVVFGKAGGFGAAIDLATIAAGTGGFAILGQDANDVSGISVASAGDVDGDGFGDLIIGAHFGDGAGNTKSNAGGSYVVFGKAGGFNAAIDLGSVAAGTGGFVIHGQDAGDLSGGTVASAGDVNGDGFGDLIIGAQLADAGGRPGPGGAACAARPCPAPRGGPAGRLPRAYPEGSGRDRGGGLGERPGGLGHRGCRPTNYRAGQSLAHRPRPRRPVRRRLPAVPAFPVDIRCQGSAQDNRRGAADPSIGGGRSDAVRQTWGQGRGHRFIEPSLVGPRIPIRRSFLACCGDTLFQDLRTAEDKGTPGPLDETGATKLRNLPRYRLPAGADSAGQDMLHRRRRNDARAFGGGGGEAEKLGVEAVADVERCQVQHPLVHQPQALGQDAHQPQGEFRGLGGHAQEIGAGEAADPGAVQRRDGGGTRGAVDGGHVAEKAAGRDVLQDQLLAAGRADRNADLAGRDEEHVGGGVVKIDQALARGDLGPVHALGEAAGQFGGDVGRQAAEQGKAVECVCPARWRGCGG